jgi:hypothetical protein
MCDYIMTKGKNYGMKCGGSAKHGILCSKHRWNAKMFTTIERDQNGVIFRLHKESMIVFMGDIPVAKDVGCRTFRPLAAIDYVVCLNNGWLRLSRIRNHNNTNRDYFKSANKLINEYHYRCGYYYCCMTRFIFKYVNNIDSYVLEGKIGNGIEQLDEYDQLLADVLKWNIIPGSSTEFYPPKMNREEEKRQIQLKEESTFKIQKTIEAIFYKHSVGTCDICLMDEKTLYYSNKCSMPHPCCKKCWQKNDNVVCPFCRTDIYALKI